MEYQQTPPAPPTFGETQIPVRPKTWLVESILVTILCCSPFSIVGIIYAAKVNSLHDQTKYEEAKRVSTNAKKWMMIGLIIGIVYIFVSIVYIFIMAKTGDLPQMSLPDSDALTF